MSALAFLLQIVMAADSFRLTSVPADGYRFERSGHVTAAAGAALSLRSTSAAATRASLILKLSARPLRETTVRIAGELRSNAITGANIYLRVEGSGKLIGHLNGFESAYPGAAEWTHFELSFPLPDAADTVAIGILVRGSGELELRNLRLTGAPLPAADAPLSDSARLTLDAAIALVKRQSIWRDTVTWSVVEPMVRRLAAGAQRSSDVYPALSVLISALGDHHSALMPPRQVSTFRQGGAQNPLPKVRALDSGLGYISVLAYGGGDPAAARVYATAVHDSLAAVLPRAPCGWVVDLRDNGGGNMWPMLAGLKPFLGGGPLGAFVSAGDRAGTPWRAGTGVNVEPPGALNGLESTRVAVLYGPRTASSGEAVAIAFRGRPNTQSFGQPTAGLSNANSMLPLPDGARINLTVAIDADRTGVRYGGRVAPDVEIAAAPGSNDDPALQRARSWLMDACR